jgi:hypothetical protein
MNRVHLRVGDLLSNPENSALGLVTKVTKEYFHFHLFSYDENSQFIISEDRARKNKVYTHIDLGNIEVYLGSEKRRRKRKIYLDPEE